MRLKRFISGIAIVGLATAMLSGLSMAAGDRVDSHDAAASADSDPAETRAERAGAPPTGNAGGSLAGAACPGDLEDTGTVDVFDLLALLDAWGPCGDPSDCPADLTGSGVVDVFDLLELLDNWGECPDDPPNPLSCEGTCGFEAPGGCWCDEACINFGDCCDDACDLCELDNCEDSCFGNCGSAAPGGCWCDEACLDFNDCCDDACDYCDHCPTAEGEDPDNCIWLPDDAWITESGDLTGLIASGINSNCDANDNEDFWFCWEPVLTAWPTVFARMESAEGFTPTLQLFVDDVTNQFIPIIAPLTPCTTGTGIQNELLIPTSTLEEHEVIYIRISGVNDGDGEFTFRMEPIIN